MNPLRLFGRALAPAPEPDRAPAGPNWESSAGTTASWSTEVAGPATTAARPAAWRSPTDDPPTDPHGWPAIRDGDPPPAEPFGTTPLVSLPFPGPTLEARLGAAAAAGSGLPDLPGPQPDPADPRRPVDPLGHTGSVESPIWGGQPGVSDRDFGGAAPDRGGRLDPPGRWTQLDPPGQWAQPDPPGRATQPDPPGRWRQLDPPGRGGVAGAGPPQAGPPWSPGEQAEAAALAAAFAADYLSWDESDPQRRGQVLAGYLRHPGPDPDRLGWDGHGRQRIEFALPGHGTVDRRGRLLVDVRARVTCYRAVGAPGADPEPVAETGTPAVAPAPTARGWRGLASRWIRLRVPVVRDGPRLAVDHWDEPAVPPPAADAARPAVEDPLAEPESERTDPAPSREEES